MNVLTLDYGLLELGHVAASPAFAGLAVQGPPRSCGRC